MTIGWWLLGRDAGAVWLLLLFVENFEQLFWECHNFNASLSVLPDMVNACVVSQRNRGLAAARNMNKHSVTKLLKLKNFKIPRCLFSGGALKQKYTASGLTLHKQVYHEHQKAYAKHHRRQLLWNVLPLLHWWYPTLNKIGPPPVFCFTIYSWRWGRHG